jgi:hypothetical protein
MCFVMSNMMGSSYTFLVDKEDLVSNYMADVGNLIRYRKWASRYNPLSVRLTALYAF